MPSDKQDEKKQTTPSNRDQDKTPKILPAKTRHLIFWPIAVIGTISDLWSKSAVHGWLETLPYETYTVIEGYFNFIIRINKGAAWSILREHPQVLLSISILAFFVVIAIFLFGRMHDKLLTIALALFTAGIAGNLYDRAFNGGGVRDFIDVTIPVIKYQWPTFNFADSFLCIAVGLIIISSFTASSSQTPVHRQKDDT